MVKYLGLEKAKTIRTSMSKEIASIFFLKLFPSYKELESLPGGYLSNLKEYLSAYAQRNAQKNIQVGSITDETENGFKLIITSCNFAQVAEIMGIPEICYWTTCVTDGYFFPEQANRAGIEFERPAIIAAGQSICDFCWKQKVKGEQSINK